MSEISKNTKNLELGKAEFNSEEVKEELKEKIVDKDFIPHFFPTYRIKRILYPLPIILVVIAAGFLAYLTYIEAGVQIDGGYIPESEFGALGGLLNGLIYTGLAGISAFVIIFIVKRKGIDILRFIFGITFGLIGFFETWFFGQIILFLIFIKSALFFNISFIILTISTAIFTILMIYKYFTSISIKTKNFIVLYIGLLIGASMGVLMPLWTTLAILIGISMWDIFAVLYKKGPIKQMIDIASNSTEQNDLKEIELKEKIKSGEAIYDTSKLEIGIGDLAFYSMLTSCALIHTNNVIIMMLTAAAIIVGTGITISELTRNKILPGLPISIFLGIGTMLLSWYIISTIF
jgi:hypothetical protein